MIEHILHHDIDKAEWDEVNQRAPQGSIYADSATLDIVSPGWEALIDRQSGIRMPLLWRRKYGFNYLFQPIGIQYTPILNAQDGAGSEEILRSIPEKFRYWDFAVEQSAIQGFDTKPRTNLELVLEGDTETLQSAYSKGHRRNMNKFPSVELKAIQPEEFMSHFSATTARTFGIGKQDRQLITRLLFNWESRGMLRLMNVTGTQSSAAFVIFGNRITFFKSANDESGREVRGMFHLLDSVIAEFAGSGMTLDFAGSDNPNTQRFYAGFGAQPLVYLQVRKNELPMPFKLFKT